MNRYVTILLLALWMQSMVAQTPLLKTLEVAPEASGIDVSLIAEDENGFLWLAGSNGIGKFDGYTYAPMNWAVLPEGSVPSSIDIIRNQLLLGLENGTVITWKIGSSDPPGLLRLGDTPVLSSTIDNEGRLWFGTNGDGLYLLTPDTLRHFGIGEGLPDLVIHELIPLQETLYVATDLGLCAISLRGTQFDFSVLTPSSGLSDNLITCMTSNGESEILLGMHNGSVDAFDPVSEKIRQVMVIPEEYRQSIFRIFRMDNEIWVLTERGELWVAGNDEKTQLRRMTLSVNNNPVDLHIPTDAIVNKEGLLILTIRENKLLLADNRIIFMVDHEGVSFKGIKALTCGSGGKLWFSTSTGLYEHDLAFSDYQHLISYEIPRLHDMGEIISLAEGPDKSIWLGTFGRGLGRMNSLDGSVQWFTEKDGLLNNNILSIAEHGGSLWLATLGGVCRVDPGPSPKFTSFGAGSPLGSSYVYSVEPASDGKIWIGTDGKGAVSFDGESKFVFLREKYPQCGKSIVSIREDNRGRIWMYGPESGIDVLDGDRLFHINPIYQGMPLEILAMNPDPQGRMFFFTTEGIAYSDGPENSIQFLLNENHTSDYLNVIVRDPEGQIWIGSNDALIRFRQYSTIRVTKPSVCLDQMLVMLQPGDTSVHEFRHDQNHFTFRIAGLWFQDPGAVRFRYMLDGYDLDWIVTQDRQIIYSQLNPGTYTLRIRCFTGAPSEEDGEVIYTFTVKEPLWKTMWFYVIVMVSAAGLVYIILRIRIRNIRRKEIIQRQLFQSQFETLRNQVNPHFLFNSFNTLVSIIEENKEQAINYVERLSEYFRLILQMRDKSTILLAEELEQVKHYFFLQETRFGNSLVVDIRLDDRVKSSLIPPMTLQILAENAIKYNIISQNRPLKIEIFAEGDFLIMRNNRQLKQVKERGTGTGLDNIRSRYKMLFGKNIELAGNDDYFVVKLPLIREVSESP